jgi:hypothetical protein
MKQDRPQTRLDVMRAARESKEAAYSAEQMAHDRLYADALDNDAGRVLRTFWLNSIINKRTSPDISDGALRGLEHTRNFLRECEAAIARYRKNGKQ